MYVYIVNKNICTLLTNLYNIYKLKHNFVL